MLPDARQSLRVDDVSFSFSVPADGWSRRGDLYISKDTTGSQGAEAMIFWARHPIGRYARACDSSPAAPISFTIAQVAADLATGVPGTELVAGPTDVTVGGRAAKQVVLFVREDHSCGPGYFYTWDGEDSRLGALWGEPLLYDTITIWLLDADGERFLIAAETHANAGAELEAEIQQIVDSIVFEIPETNPVAGDYTQGRHSTTVDSTTFSFAIATRGWGPYPEGGGAVGSTLIDKSVGGPGQGAEEVIYWAGYPQSSHASSCGVLGDSDREPTVLGVATKVASAPGTDLVTGPEEVTVGGRPAVRVVVAVREALGCNPGFFYGWTPQEGGTMWTETEVGDTIQVWVVEVGTGRLLFIGGATAGDAAGGEEEIQQIVDSIEFEPNLPAVRFAEALTPLTTHSVTTDGVLLTYSVPSEWARYDELYLSKDTGGSNTAEAMVLWARYPEGRLAQTCDWSRDRPGGATPERLATSLSTDVPGTELVEGPIDDTVGGVPAVRVVLSVRDQSSACGPGYFITWKDPLPGRGWSWGAPAVGDTITIWVLDLGETPFLIVSETHRGARAWLAAEAQSIVDSIEFL